MPKSVDIADFSTKLGLVAKQLNWSGAKLAQEVGVDKSIAARWLNDRSKPTSNSLMQLTRAVAQSIAGFKNADWELPLDKFAKRLGLDGVAMTRNAGANDRLTLRGLKFPPVADWGKPYLGLWVGFYQSVTNGGRPLMCAARFFIDDLGLRISFTTGDFGGEGPALASRSHLQCLIDVGPLHDRLAFFVFNGVHAPQALSIDGVVSVMAGDSTGTPTAMMMVLFRVDRDMTLDNVDVQSLSGAIMQTNRRSRDAHESSGDPLAVMAEFAPVEILRTLYPVVGVAHDDGEIDHVLRLPVSRSLASGNTGDVTRGISGPTLSEIASKLRRAVGLERARPHLRVLNQGSE
jgi:transcriptional regulator with XRE-family HTH domain